MSQPNPLSAPAPWDRVSAAYVEDVVPFFAAFAHDAVRLAGLRAGQRVVDVATGPGTLAFVAAGLGAHVSAIDFSPVMIDALRERARREGIGSIEAVVGDGQALPFEDASFDAAFSMFGLMFFLDRVRGLREIRRVLRPGAPAVVSSWQPIERTPVLVEVFGAIREFLPGVPFGTNKAPLALADDYRIEMGDAGLRGIEVHETVHAVDATSPSAFWELSQKSNAAVAVLRERLSDKWPAVDASIRERLRARFGDGPLRIEMVANLAIGRA